MCVWFGSVRVCWTMSAKEIKIENSFISIFWQWLGSASLRKNKINSSSRSLPRREMGSRPRNEKLFSCLSTSPHRVRTRLPSRSPGLRSRLSVIKCAKCQVTALSAWTCYSFFLSRLSLLCNEVCAFISLASKSKPLLVIGYWLWVGRRQLPCANANWR